MGQTAHLHHMQIKTPLNGVDFVLANMIQLSKICSSRRGTPRKNGWGVRSAFQNRFPIYDLTKNLMSYLWPLRLQQLPET